MAIKVVNAMKNMIFSSLLLFVFSCSSDDVLSVDPSIIGGKNFLNVEISKDVAISSEAVTRIPTSSVGQYLFGSFTDDPFFGNLTASFVTQLQLPSNMYRYNLNVEPESIVTSSINDVYLVIPYQSTLLSSDGDENTYQLDSIYGQKDTETEETTIYQPFDFTVHELSTFLNTLNPENPSQSKVYYSDDIFEVKTDVVLASETDYSPSANETLSFISRKIDGEEYQKDTVYIENFAPRLAIPLDKEFFKERFLDKMPLNDDESMPDEFSSQDNFIRYFKGIYLKASPASSGAMASLLLNNAYVDLYYTNVISNISTGDGIDTIAETKRFIFAGVKANVLEKAPPVAAQTGVVTVQGTLGSLANVHILGYDPSNPTVISSELEEMRSDAQREGWLVNDAKLRVYVDTESMSEVFGTVSKLYLYKKVPSINGNPAYNSQLVDYMESPALLAAQGTLVTDNDLQYYEFTITDYITDLLSDTATKNVDNLGLKLYTEGDYPLSFTDTIISARSWNPNGVILDTDLEGNKTTLKINYLLKKE
jgi:hypothetical protein